MAHPVLNSPEYLAALTRRAARIRLPHQRHAAMASPLAQAHAVSLEEKIDEVYRLIYEIRLGWWGRRWRWVRALKLRVWRA